MRRYIRLGIRKFVSCFTKKSLQRMNNKTSIIVKNIPAGNDGSEQELREFFNYCGDIVNMQLQESEQGMYEAIIQFDSEAGVKTALVLDGATLGGRALVIQEAPAGFVLEELDVNDEQAEVEQVEAPEEEDDLLNSVFLTFKQVGDSINQKFTEIDQDLQISTKLNEAGNTIKSKIDEVDGNLELSVKAKEARDTASAGISNTFNDIDNFVKTNETLNTIGAKTSETFNFIGETATNFWNSLTQ
eukprot:TRINITY_DN1848_c0_g1_i1.p1 TRINITY_DN1848_c0_g1~~TRINITY_DN1848_c0_g1_i1.p1  ORF type:complete len:244 (+),score=59.54 TRINITY_DN1848_c0_g1_i1:2-733(+)